MITGIILASGFSRRMGSDKLLLPVDGIAMVERVMRAADASALDDVILVYQNPDVLRLAGRYRIRPAYNPDAALGQSASIRAGLRAARPRTRAYMFLTGDQPRLDHGTINLIARAWQDCPECIVVPSYGGRRGSPTVFPAHCRDSLLALTGDTGGRSLIERCPDMVRCISMPDDTAGIDVDTPAEYEHCTHGRNS